MRVNLSLDQWQPLYEQLIERDSVVPLERQPDSVTVRLKDGTYVIPPRVAYSLLQNLRQRDNGDGIPDGVIAKQWLLGPYLRQLGVSDLPIIPADVVSYRPADEFVPLREGLKNERLVVLLNDQQQVTDAKTTGLLDLAVTTAYYAGWTPEKLLEVKEAFRRVGAHPFYFCVRLDFMAIEAFFIHLHDPAQRGFPEGHYYGVNLRYPAEKRMNVWLQAEHERIHGAVWASLARRYPTLAMNAGNERRYQKDLFSYFGRFFQEQLGPRLPSELRERVGWALKTTLGLFWLEESVVTGYHTLFRSEQLKSEYEESIGNFISDLSRLLASPPGINTDEILFWAAHDAALAYAIGRDDLAERIRSMFAGAADLLVVEPHTASAHPRPLREVYDDMVTLHRFAMRSLHGLPGSPKIF